MLGLVRSAEAYQLIKQLARLSLVMLIWMSFLRILLYFAVYQSLLQSADGLMLAFYSGARFDLLVLGFLWIPLIFGLWITPIFASVRKIVLLVKFYFVIAVLFIFDMAWFDLFWSKATGQRLNSLFFQPNAREILDRGWEMMGTTGSLVLTLLMGLTSLGIVVAIYQLRLEKVFETPKRGLVVCRVFFTFFLVALAARGTLTAHHLNIEHSQISENKVLNQLPLNAVWNMDK